MDYCMRAYGAKSSDRQIKNLPISTENQLPNLMLVKFSCYTVYMCLLPCWSHSRWNTFLSWSTSFRQACCMPLASWFSLALTRTLLHMMSHSMQHWPPQWQKVTARLIRASQDRAGLEVQLGNIITVATSRLGQGRLKIEMEKERLWISANWVRLNMCKISTWGKNSMCQNFHCAKKSAKEFSPMAYIGEIGKNFLLAKIST